MSKNWKGFYRLLNRYQKGKVNPQEKEIMDIWYDSIDHTEDKQETNDETQRVNTEIWSAIKKGIAGNAEEKGSPIRRWWLSGYTKLAAACFLLLIGFISYRTLSNHSSIIAGVTDSVIEEMKQTANTANQAITITLSDGSQVKLEPGSSLYYPESFSGNKREVYLKGDAFFDITPNPNKPFLVNAANIVTRVVGTSFTIKENTSRRSVEVAVISGTVEVRKLAEHTYSEKNDSKVILTPNKRATFYEKEEKLVTGLVEKPQIIDNKRVPDEAASFVFRETQLSSILSLLESAYGVKIDLSNKAIQRCVITADLSQDKTLFAQLEILCAAIDANFVVNQDRILLTGNGCEINY